MISKKLISIIIPAFNCAETIDPTIKSILASGILDYEIILVDDGSNDGTDCICNALAKGNDRILCVHQKNAGVSAARNRGIREASGEYIWFIDADDSIRAGSIPPVEEILQMQAPDMLVFGIEFNYYHHGRIYRWDKMIPPLEGMKETAACDSLIYDLFETNSLSALWSRIIKRSVISSTDSFLREDMFVYEDLEFVLRVWNECKSVYFYPEALYQYRQSEDEGNAGRRLKKIPHIPELLRKIGEPLADKPAKDKILLSLYLTLAREKISVSDKKGVETVCSDFRAWIDNHSLKSAIRQKQYPMMIYNGQVSKILAKRRYSKIRHSVANWLKKAVGDFRKW